MLNNTKLTTGHLHLSPIYVLSLLIMLGLIYGCESAGASNIHSNNTASPPQKHDADTSHKPLNPTNVEQANQSNYLYNFLSKEYLLLDAKTLAADAWSNPELVVGKDVDALKHIWGNPTMHNTLLNGNYDLVFLKIEIRDKNGNIKLKTSSFLQKGQANKDDTILMCRTIFSIHKSGLVLSKRQMGNNCNKSSPTTDDEINNDFELLTRSVGWKRYDSIYGRTYVAAITQRRFQNDEYSKLEELYNKLIYSKQHFNNGAPKLRGFYDVFDSSYISSSNNNYKYKSIKTWRKDYPTSPAAAIVEAAYWKQMAWKARGYGYSSSVSPEGWKLYKRRLNKGLNVLNSSQEYASKDPYWYTLYIDIATGLNWDKSKILEIFDRGYRQNGVFLPSYHSVMASLLPRWGGSYHKIDNFIQEQTAKLDGDNAATLYTNLYWTYSDYLQPNINFFKRTNVNWKKMKHGFLVLQKKYPYSFFTANVFAYFSCMAGDKEEYQKLRPTIEKYLYPRLWPTNYNIDVCDSKMLNNA